MDKEIHNLTSSLKLCSNLASLNVILLKLSNLLQFDYYSYLGGILIAGERIIAPPRLEKPIVQSNLNKQFTIEYALQRLDYQDPVIKRSSNFVAFQTWNMLFNYSELSSKEKRVLNLGYDFNINDGFIIPVHGAGSFYSLLAFSGEDMIAKTFADDLNNANLHFFAVTLHGKIQELCFEKSDPAIMRNPLTPREIDVLRWIAEGKTKWEVAQILKVSKHTVGEHIKKAREKLNATNQTHAIAKMTQM